MTPDVTASAEQPTPESKVKSGMHWGTTSEHGFQAGDRIAYGGSNPARPRAARPWAVTIVSVEPQLGRFRGETDAVLLGSVHDPRYWASKAGLGGSDAG